jgi:hypothetical protein
VTAYIRDEGLKSDDPYTLGGNEHRFTSRSFIVRIDGSDTRNMTEPLNLIIEVTGVHDISKEAKSIPCTQPVGYQRTPTVALGAGNTSKPTGIGSTI